MGPRRHGEGLWIDRTGGEVDESHGVVSATVAIADAARRDQRLVADARILVAVAFREARGVPGLNGSRSDTGRGSGRRCPVIGLGIGHSRHRDGPRRDLAGTDGGEYDCVVVAAVAFADLASR